MRKLITGLILLVSLNGCLGIPQSHLIIGGITQVVLFVSECGNAPIEKVEQEDK